MDISAPLSRSSYLWLLACMLLVLAPHVERLPIGLLVGYGACLVWRTLIHYNQAKMPSAFIKLLLIVLGLVVIRQGYQNLLGVDPAAAFLLLAFVFKFLEAQRIRDALLVIFLGYFCLPIAFLFSQTILMTLYVLIALTVITSSLVKVVKPQDQASGQLDMKLVSQMLLSSVPLMLVLFVLVPRIGPLWSVPLPSGHAKTGPSDSMSPGDIASLAKSDELAFRVEFEGAIPNTRNLYWRGIVLSDFDGRTWRMSRSHDQQKRLANWGDKNNLQDKLPVSSQLLSYQITFEASHQPWLYALDYPLTSSLTVGLTKEFTLIAKAEQGKRSHYSIKSSPTWTVDPILSPFVRKRNLELPLDNNERAKQFATGLRSRLDTDQQFVNEILNYYRQQPFYYSLKPPRLGKHTVDEFLFETRIGFCEHYAGSFVFLMRAAGVPARVIAGYQGGEINREGNYLLVHQFDAHAWAEVWLPSRGWVRIDPTAQVAPERIEYGIEEATAYENSFLSDSPFSLVRYRNNRWLSQLRLKLDAIEYDWNRWVLGYDANRQSNFLKNYFGLDTREEKTQTLILLFVSCLVAITVIFVRKERAVKLNRSDQHYLRFCRLMEKRGLARGVGEGPKDFSSRLINSLPNEANRIRTITRLYSHLTYGPTIKGSQRKRMLNRLESEIKALKQSMGRI